MVLIATASGLFGLCELFLQMKQRVYFGIPKRRVQKILFRERIMLSPAQNAFVEIRFEKDSAKEVRSRYSSPGLERMFAEHRPSPSHRRNSQYTFSQGTNAYSYISCYQSYTLLLKALNSMALRRQGTRSPQSHSVFRGGRPLGEWLNGAYTSKN